MSSIQDASQPCNHLQQCELQCELQNWHSDVLTLCNILEPVMQDKDKSGFILSEVGYIIAPFAMHSGKSRTRLNINMIVANLHCFYRDKTLNQLLAAYFVTRTYISPH